MKKSSISRGLFLLVIVSLIFSSCTACSQEKRSVYARLEVAPEKYAILKFLRSGEMYLRYNNQIVHLGEVGRSYEPVTIMAYKEKIYVIKTDFRSDKAADRHWDFYEQAGEKLKQIPASEFPRSIAVRNVWAPGQGKLVDRDGNIVLDYLKIARERDVNNSHFRGSISANLWYHLETGASYSYMETRGMDVDAEFLRNYIAKYDPVRLKFEEMERISKEEAGF